MTGEGEEYQTPTWLAWIHAVAYVFLFIGAGSMVVGAILDSGRSMIGGSGLVILGMFVWFGTVIGAKIKLGIPMKDW